MEITWELIAKTKSSWLDVPLATERARVPGGWLVRTWFKGAEMGGMSMIFYPDPEHTWGGASQH